MTAPPTRSSCFSPPGDVERVVWTPSGALLELGLGAAFRIDVLRADIVRVKLTLSGTFDETPTSAVPGVRMDPAEFTLGDTPEALTLATAALSVVVQKRPFALSAARRDGSPLIMGRTDAEGSPLGLRVLNDEFWVQRRLSAGDSIHGLGEKTGPFERRGRRYVLWNLDVHAPRALELNHLLDEVDPSIPPASVEFDPYYSSVPFFQHVSESGGVRRVAGFFIDNAYRASFDFSPVDGFEFHFGGGQYTEYVFAGPDYGAVLEAYTFVTGRPELPPLWALGHHQCRWHDYTDAQIRQLGSEYRSRGIPCDALWLDIGHMDGFRVFTWHKERFPEPKALAEALLEDGFRLVTIVDPGIKVEEGYAIFGEARARNLLCKTEGGAIYTGQVWPGRSAFPDFSMERARAFWSDLVREHLAHGVAGIWNDMNEPATGDVDPFGMRFDAEGRNGSHERFHNQYASLMALATRAGQLAHAPELRPFTLSRAGFAGIQRLAAQWLGDNQSSFEHLALSVPMALGMGVSGQPFVGADIPGFAGAPTPELAARWFELGALTPFCRCHNMLGAPPKYPWSFGPEVEAVARNALGLRYRLLPYLYAAFLRASESGEPIMRPLCFDFPNEPDVLDGEDQFLLGEALLVAPILRVGARERQVRLPRGDWFDWQSGERFSGGQLVRVAAPLEKIPLFARGNFVIPCFESAPSSTRGYRPELIELHWFVSEANTGRGLLFEDDGETTGYREGAFVRTTFLVEPRAGRELSLSARREGRGFPGFQRRFLRLVLHGARTYRVWLGGAQVSPDAQGAVTFENSGEDFELIVEASGINAVEP